MDRISLYWKNATAGAVGEKHGVSPKELKGLALRIKAITKEMADQRKAGKLRYRDLPYDSQMIDDVNREVEHFRDRCDTLIVLGIGGSALGNIALQSALNPWTYNYQSDRTRTGPQLFVLDNVDPDQIRSVIELVTPKLKRSVKRCARVSPARPRRRPRSSSSSATCCRRSWGSAAGRTSSRRPIRRAARCGRSPMPKGIARFKCPRGWAGDSPCSPPSGCSAPPSAGSTLMR